jgi:PAS domain S-box-containing protein
MPRLLIIDDKRDNLISIEALLKNLMEGLEIISALSGKEGIALAKKENPDLILLDIYMPEMDGFEVCKKLKSNKLTKPIPIIMLTAIKTDQASKLKGLELGADAFLTKPLDESEIVSQIKVMLRIKAAENDLREKNIKLEKIVAQRTIELSEREDQYKTLVDNSLVGMYIIQDGIIQFHNNKFAEIFGFKKNEKLVEKPILELVAKESHHLVSKMIKRRINGELNSTHYNFIGHKTNGQNILIESLGGRILLGGEPAVQGVLRDITEINKLDEMVRKLSRAVDQSPVSVAITDLRGNIEYVNSAYLKVTGYQMDELIGKSSNILKSGHTKDEEYKDLWKAILNGKEWKGEFLNKRKNGELFWEDASISPIKDQDQTITHFLGIKQDISNRKRLENEVIYAKEKAEEADNLKTAFLANMSHEIRTPMNAIMGFSNLLLDESMSQEDRLEYIDLINSNSRNLLKLIDDIFDIARIEAGQLKVSTSNFNFTNTLQEIHSSFKQFTIKKAGDKINLELALPEIEHHGFIHSDPLRLKQILSNLVANALKYTEQGSVKLGYNIISANASANNRPLLQFFVKDTGIGIPQNKMTVIFDRFRQADDSHTREYGGTGLGLAISKNIAQLLGGNLRAVSSVGKGSVFYLTIPLEEGKVTPIDRPEEPAKSKLDWTDKIILIAEDVESNFQLLETLLRKTGANIMWAKNGVEAIEVTQKTKGIDMILMDIQMPVLNGFEATKAIKKTHESLPVIAITAFALEGDKEKILQAGCDDYISKPVRSKELFAKMSKFIDK